MQNQPRRAQFPSRPEGSRPNVTGAVGMQEPAGRQRARRQSLFTQTVIWVTGLICLSFLLATLAQAWSNSQLMQRVQASQQQMQQLQQHHDALTQAEKYYNNPFVVESEARQQLGYVRPGEHAVIVLSSNDSQPHHSSKHSTPPQQQGFWQAWWNLFFSG